MRRTPPRYIAYSARKDALIAMTKLAALEHAHHGIRVNALCPAAVRLNGRTA